MDNIEFTEDEIQEQLVLLGYKNIPKHRLSEFKKGSFSFCLCPLWMCVIVVYVYYIMDLIWILRFLFK